MTEEKSKWVTQERESRMKSRGGNGKRKSCLALERGEKQGLKEKKCGQALEKKLA